VATQRLRAVLLPALAGLAAAIGCGGGTGPSTSVSSPPFAAVSAGGYYTCGVTATGAAYCWGNNSIGGLGDGTTTERLTPVRVAGGVSFAAVSEGIGHTCAVTAAGAAYCWGSNDRGELGDGTRTGPQQCSIFACSTTPVAVAGGVSFAAVSAGEFHTCGVTAGGAAYCWGDNTFGQLGDGTTTFPSSPVLVAGGVIFAAVSAGSFHTCGVTAAGAAYCWGYNGYGQLGNGTTTNRLTPMRLVE
jgi:alpha-tubulin suppressor-like RCC1 family protein